MSGLRASVAIAISAVMLMASAAAQTTQPSAASPFPAGPGRDALFKVCADCHGPESVLGQLKTPDEWSKTLDEMAAQGAQGSDEEWKSILDYLSTHYSLIFVNTDSAKDLAARLDVPKEAAEAIVRTRTERGKFKSINDLKQVPGLDGARVEARKDRLIF